MRTVDTNRIGQFIAEQRRKKKLTQQQLGDMLYVTDKAVSKWERGLSLPDISILEKLADILDTDIYHILQIENRKNVDVSKILQEERKKIQVEFRKKILFLAIPVMLLVGFVLYKLLPFGYDVVPTRFYHNTDKVVYLGVPKFSFYFQNNDTNYSYKSLRGKSVLQSEVKNYLNSLDHISCNSTTYYYDSVTDTTIVDYYVASNLLYSTISYTVRNGNYCNEMERLELREKLGNLNTFRTLYTDNSNLIIYFLPEIHIQDGKNVYSATMKIYWLSSSNESHVLEESKGTFQMNGDELVYYREEITKQDESITIPNVSTFVVKNQKLILKDNYLDPYENNIILK